MTQTTINQMIEVLRKENAIELLSVPNMTVPTAYKQVMTMIEEREAAAREQATAAEQNGKLYTEAEMDAIVDAKVEAKMKEFLVKMTETQAQKSVPQQADSQAQPAASMTQEEKEAAAKALAAKHGVGTWEYARVSTASGLRTGGDFIEESFKFIGDVFRDGMHATGGFVNTGIHVAANWVDVAPEDRTQAQSEQPAAQTIVVNGVTYVVQN